MTAVGSPRPDRSDWTAWLCSCVCERLMKRPPDYSLPPLPCLHDSLSNMDRAVRRYSRKTNDNTERTAYVGMPMPYEAIGSPGTTSPQEVIIENK